MDPVLALEVSSMARMRSIFELEAKGNSDIQLTYKNATVFITGGSGFLGKQLIEKLLRSTDVKKVYLLLRPKKGKTVQDRLNEILQDPLFEGLRRTKPGFEECLVPIVGDITALGLGIADEDKDTLTTEVNFVFHVAATTRFDESLASATITNVRGTREVIALAKTCLHLRAFVHISTAFCHATITRRGQNVLEDFYPVPIPPHTLIDMVEKMDFDKMEAITSLIMKDWPNTYSFTKAVAEELVRTVARDIPACIVRPSIVISPYREPAPGWVDGSVVFGPAGVMLGVGLGLIHTMLADGSVNIDVVPADLVNNAVIAAGSRTASNEELKIYTVSNSRNSTTWGTCADVHRTESRKISTPKAVWYCYCYDTSNRLVFNLLFWLLHYIPAYIMDGVCFLSGKPRRFVKLYAKAHKLFTLFSFFTTNEWRFKDDNLQTLYKGMSDTDRQIYNIDVTCIDWKELMLIWCMGLRKYIVKDGLSGTAYAVRKQQFLRIANAIVLIVYAYIWWQLFNFVFIGLKYFF